MTEELNSYINSRYQRWLDYARYHCALAGLVGEEQEVLHTVLVTLIDQGQDKLLDLYHKKKQGYTELDFYILAAIKLNCHSKTSPYRHKFRSLPADRNTDVWSLEILDEGYDSQPEYKERILSGMRLLRISFNWTYLEPLERSIVEMNIWHDKPIYISSRILHISYTAGREYYHSGISKIRDTARHITQLRKVHQN